MISHYQLTSAPEARRDNKEQALGDGRFPLVSVAIACYNQAHFLASALDSVRAQSYPNIEVVVVDDGSIDDTREVCGAYAGVRYVHQVNQGLSAARNMGLRHSHGAYVVFLDADDCLLPEAIESGVRAMAANPQCAFVSGHFRYINADGSPLRETPQNRVERDHYLALLRGNYIGMHAAVMYRRSVFEQVGDFDTSLAACEDYDLYLRVARTFPIYCHSEVVAEYRQHGANMSGDPVFMLRHALRVLRRQQGFVRHNVARVRAYLYGMLAWQVYCGRVVLRRASPVRTGVDVGRRAHQWIGGQGRGLLKRWRAPRIRQVRLGDLGKGELGQHPVAQYFIDTHSIDQRYIQRFVASQALYLHGEVLNVGSSELDLGRDGDGVVNVTHLDLDSGTDHGVLLDDLRCADHFGDGSFDCVVVAHVLHRVYDLSAAMQTLYRLLKPGGVLLATLPGLGFVKPMPDVEVGYWAFTEYSARQMLAEVFAGDTVWVQALGNVLAAVARLHGIGVEALTASEVDYRDAQFQCVITARATKQ